MNSSRKSSLPLVTGVLILAAAAGVAFWGIATRARALTQVARETEDLRVTTVAFVTPEHTVEQDEVILPATLQPYQDASIYARTNGYLKRWTADIGARVKAGQLLAEIDAPEIDEQLLQARADLATAEANTKLAQSTADRYRELIKSDSVAQQDLDNANGSLAAKLTMAESARFNVKRLEQLQSFSRVEAPFSGVITARNVDVGALIATSGTRELFHIASTDRLRVFVNVPQVYSQAARPGLKADITLKEFPKRRFTGTLMRTAQSIEIASRTLLTEVDVDNPTGELLPGAYAELHLKLPAPTASLKLPATTLIFKAQGLQVATVDSAGRIALVSVTAGRDFGDSIEILDGLKGDERVVTNPPDSLVAGQVVRVGEIEK
jgi:RND family efflux transporter MFP subunit